MSERRTLVLDEQDLIVYACDSPDAVRAAFKRLYDFSRQRVGRGPEGAFEHEAEPRSWRLVFGLDNTDITTRQRGFFHAVVLAQIAEQACINGTRYAAKTWKEHYRERFLGEEWVTVEIPGRFTARGAPRKKRIKRRISTEDLGAKAYAEHIDRVMAEAAVELGVRFLYYEHERDAVRFKPRKKLAANAA